MTEEGEVAIIVMFADGGMRGEIVYRTICCKGWYVYGDTNLFLIGLNLIQKADRMCW
jgi:hypothetical protein